MSEHASPTAAAGDPVTLEPGLEALQSSPEFDGPVEQIDGHHCNDHFAHVYETDEERFAAAVPFARHGLEQGEYVIYVVEAHREPDVRAALRDGGVDVEAAVDSGQLAFHTAEETYLRNESFEPDEMLEFYADAVAEATDEYEALRIVAETSWLDGDNITYDQFMEYEAKVNQLFDAEDSLALCQYDRDRFPPEFVRGIVESHPHLIYNDSVCHNVYYTPPDEVFDEDPAREVDRMLGTLYDRAEAKTELQHRDQFLRDLYAITASQDRSLEAKLDALFELGCEQFDLDFGFLNRVDPTADHLEIEHASGDHEHYEVGGELPLSETYCKAAVDIEAAASITDPAAEGYDDLFVYEEFGVDGYFGTYIPVDGGPDRTLAFVPDADAQSVSVSEQDRMYLELMGQWVGYELNRRQREQFLHECYEITADPDKSFEEKLHGLFEVGCDRFGLDVGGLAKVDPDTDLFEVEHVAGEHDILEPGARADLSETYCRLLAEDGDTAAVTDPVDAGFEDNLCYKEFGVQSYLGTHLEIEGDDDRSFWFVSTEPRDTPITDEERTFVHLMGQWVQYELERHQRERELRERTEHLSALIETTPECIKTVAEDGTLIQMNPAGLDMVEAPAESAVVGENVYDLIAPEHREKFTEFNEQVCRGDGGTLEFDIIGLEGTRRHMESHAVPLERPSGTTVHVALTRDITERKEREQELRQTKTRFETVFEQSNDGIFLIDPDADEFVDANPAAAEMTGYTRDELLSLRPSDLHPDELEQFRAFLDEAQETGSAWSEDLHCRHKDGHDIPAETTASAITLDGRDLVLANVRNIDERKQHERYQRDLYEIVADAEASFDEKLDRLLELGRERFGLENGCFNRIHADAHEFEVVAAVGPHDMLEPGAVDSLAGTYCEMHLDSNDPLAAADVADTGLDDLRSHDEYGLEAYLAATVHIGGDDYGTLCFASETPHDKPFTEAEQTFLDLMGQCIRYELERDHREAQLEQKTDRLESFASLLAHELRNPVTIGQIYSQQLPEEADAEAVDYVAEAFDRIEDMIDVMLILTRGREAISERTPMDLADVTRKAWDTVDAPDAALDVAIDHTIQADETYIRHLFRNLLENAVEHGGADVTVTVGELPDVDGFYVADDGTGIPPEERDAIFDEGYTTAADNGGTGLGLAFVQKLANVYEWDLAVTDSDQGGARFEFRNIT